MRRRLRRELPAELVEPFAAFRRCAEHVDLAQRAMIRCVPSSARSVALPLSVGADTVRLSLAEARALLTQWRHPLVEDEWQACRVALDATEAAVASAVAAAAATRELEVALTAVQDLLDPLHAFVEAEARFASLRVRG